MNVNREQTLWPVVLLGVGVIAYKGNGIFGIDFSGGDVVTASYKQKIEIGKIREIAKANGMPEINVTYVNAIGGGGETLKLETPEGKAGLLLGALQAWFLMISHRCGWTL